MRSAFSAREDPAFVITTKDPNGQRIEKRKRAESYGTQRKEKVMRKLMLSVLLGLGIIGFTASTPSVAKASWLSEAIDHTHVDISIGAGYPAYQAYGSAPIYPAYRPVPTYGAPAYSYPAYRPAYAPACRPAPAYVPQQSFYGPNRFEQGRNIGHVEYRGQEWHR
jgi:hypothetical protein